MNSHETHAKAARPSACGGVIYVDATHMGRAVTGIERISAELFSQQALSPLPVRPVGPPMKGTAGLVAGQYVSLPARLARDPGAIALCPGFPPSLVLSRFGARVIPYIHDLFLLTRRADLSARARLYMAPAFRHAVRRLPRFFVNSRSTANELARFARADAQIHLYRPRVRNVFGLNDAGRAGRSAPGGVLRLVALGTLEPRKNLLAAAEIIAALRGKGFARARLDIIGREGWGGVAGALRGREGVVLHGYQPEEAIRRIMHSADAFITTSHDEGLGLPLLEAQYAGLPVIAPDAPVFREVLQSGGVFINPARPGDAAERIAAVLSGADAAARFAEEARANISLWNARAEADRSAIIALLARLSAAAGAREAGLC